MQTAETSETNGTTVSIRLRMSKFPEGELKEFGGFPYGHLHTEASRDVGMYIHKRWAGKAGEKVLRNTAGCLKLPFGDLNFSCLSRVCPCGTEHPVNTDEA